MLFVVTGASGSGKSACLPGLHARFPDMVWYEFDSLGVPLGAGTAWRQQATEHWLRCALHHQAQGQDMGLCGQCVFGEILACPSAPQITALRVGLLECSDVTLRIDRLRACGAGGDSQDMLSWAAWLRMHSVDPQWRPDVIRVGAAPEMHWERWEDWQRGDPRWTVWTLDTVSLDVEHAVMHVAQWIEEQRRLR